MASAAAAARCEEGGAAARVDRWCGGCRWGSRRRETTGVEGESGAGSDKEATTV